jgi:hypothetical protein
MKPAGPIKTLARIEVLTPEEVSDLESIECRIRRNVESVRDTVECFLEIRDRKLYRHHYESFDAYCRGRWSTTLSYMSRLAFHDTTRIQLAVALPDAPPPTSESQTRELKAVEEDRRPEVYAAAVADADGAVPTAKQVKAAAARVAPKPAPVVASDDDAVAELRAGGFIPADAHVDVVHDPAREATAGPGTPSIEDVPIGTPAETDAEYLAKCPAHSGLTGAAAKLFSAEALLFHAVTPARLAFVETVRPLASAAKRSGGGKSGPWHSDFLRFFGGPDPTRWKACGPCGGTGRVVLMEKSGRCDACRGNGYTTR